MSYVSPIKIGYEAEPEEGWTDKIGKYLAGEVDNLVLQSCVKVGCQVDKDELEKALRYDRDQYVKGYEDGKRDAAAAIEALIGTVGDLQAIRERLEEENDALRLEPKRGEIVRCRECRWGHLCVMGQHLGLDGFCSKGEREAQIIKSVTMREGDTDTDGFFRKAVEAVTEVQE